MMDNPKLHKIFMISEDLVNPDKSYESPSWSMWLDLSKRKDTRLELKEVNSESLWNEMFNKYSYNKNLMPPKNSFLDQLFISYYPECLGDKRYGKSVMWRFLPLINYFYKLIYKIKIYRRNYEILKS